MKKLVKCNECSNEMEHLYSPEEIEKNLEDYEKEIDYNSLNPIMKFQRDNYELSLRREYICRSCGYIKTLSLMEITKEFTKTMMEQGKSSSEILKEVDEFKTKGLEVFGKWADEKELKKYYVIKKEKERSKDE